jgi:hypothetical protein
MCADFGMTLAGFETEEEFRAIIDYVSSNPGKLQINEVLK